ncbi:hypothetical protein PSN45_002435 [Yamadazyma tenuis]|uniref:CWH43-like N-terminal domain-containing protein n=1 Tax=Candida tenuis (strain ATCC 10573 / BCRC 21748 / CBS 615 / JCM 9827 / NBRC 10315 / NRRL Y-1498 / VKM Y-70) TaxID=590646 RepID=G3B0G8_CANTC|nr:uncharacterized protein CANTEDRAFT_119750 [Yamadazyma tenuis ATCC 10573]XP_006685086.1 uncharacterized protein CANTEDRAFT_119750 [Yamadazyma tenuis ATCC 10573]EGV65399.1 hypothetical protein CANTEDRAFT_119750 [Yamadazyma tenuis ATCC 10573]EGV65400.1 hypothetical protein CANTEDRAFT_119750 [Yamadazyma tenuis ATCC 10573]WEJ94933.1 hypothetical protein PSN45_002435 [Yamadazyma tenuis]
MLLKFKVVHYYLIPLVCLVVWWGMLTALMVCWVVQNKPQYSWNTEYQVPPYISDLGATNLQPLFISCAGFQAIFFVGTLTMEYFLRRYKKLQPFVSKKQPLFSIISIVCAIIGQLGILFVSIFKTTRFHRVHLSMVAVFIVFSFFTCVFNFLNSFIFGYYPTRLSPNHEKVIFGTHRWANLYMVSFVLKTFWLVGAVVFAVLFGWYMKDDHPSLSAAFEWTISYWYGFLLVLWAIDLFPSAVKHYQLRHPDQYPEKDLSHIHLDPNNPADLTKLEERSVSTFGSPTFAGQEL